jgi:hypothetical protein
MTRRVRNKLASEGSLRVVAAAPPLPARIPDARVATLQAKKPGKAR